ncbi:MAG: hypothetical protein EVA28_01580 [Candidatus Actinomarinales bacterium]|nr:MAG: hypothetical protein EVA28_01580 [Candidatus Actinomarinales bacterium]
MEESLPTNPKEAVTPFDRELKKLKEIWSKEYLLELAKEFKETPFGTHSEDLQHLLNIMRGAPIPGKYMIYMPDSNKTYIIAQHDTNPPYEPVLTDMQFNNFIDAEWPVFCLRFEEMFSFNPKSEE